MKVDGQALLDGLKYHLQREGVPQISDATYSQLFRGLSETLMDWVRPQWEQSRENSNSKGAKQAYYLSLEILIGRMLGNNLMNLTLYREIKELLEEQGIDLNLLEDSEPEPGLGNGGLGRLAACFMDSMATERLPGMGYGLYYKYGIFNQKIENGYQVEYPDNWLERPYPWTVERMDRARTVKFGGSWNHQGEGDGLNQTEDILAVPYDMPVIGYDSHQINTLRLWEARPVVGFNFQLFNQEKYQQSVMAANNAEHITRVLYPSDNGKQGKILRLKQQYLFVSASLQDILHDFKNQYGKQYELFPQKAVLQLNDTHPVVAIPELMRLLIDVEELTWDQAWDITSRSMAYTNHTVLSEALEKWSVDIFRPLLPRIYNIIEEINHRFLAELKHALPQGESLLSEMSIIESGQVRMAWLAIAGCFSVNGVAWLHTEILKKDVLKNWYALYPHKFNNKTNGVTQRRWLLKCNPRLSDLISEKIGREWIKDLSQLSKLKEWKDDKTFLESLQRVKQANKEDLAQYIKDVHQITLDPSSIFDVQIKRLHEYKRQLLNVMHIIRLYKQIKANPQGNYTKRSFIFGAKAAPGYHMAKQIIKLITSVANKVNNDRETMDIIKVIFLENYRVSLAERLFPASDISEQISTAGKEASGTGNMKFMLNGALTLGTMDGANIEIVQEAGEENCYIFGLRTEQIANIYSQGDYNPKAFLNEDKELEVVMNSLIDGSFGEPRQFQDIYNSLLTGNHPDVYFIINDFRSYCDAQDKIAREFNNKEDWHRKALMNIASAGKFSSDRTIREYASEIWGIEAL
ncbi:MAG: glycogen/starch/alpha-glucan phosphorylase [Spirochaetaceae bacterium]|jgi:starch phosphorylase|nr:glycogen/starch/alpha-glucan phosphorylase [Spirochaetaceae bacterium]